MHLFYILFFMVTVTPHSVYAQAKGACKPQSQQMSVEQALKEAAQILSGPALTTAKRKINEQSIGGMKIDKQVFQKIIQETLEHGAPKETAEKLTMGITKVDIDPKSTLEVPADIKGKVFYLKVAQQGKDECGYRVIYNAKAFDELLKAKVLISQGRIDEKASKLAKEWSIKECQLDDEGIITQAAAQGLREKSYILREVAKQLKITDGPSSEDFNGYKMIAKFKDPSAATQAIFFTHYKGHWVVAIALKDKNAKPIIIFMNSNNAPMTRDSEPYKILLGLLKTVGA